jgi:hypothetical protein
VKSCGKLDLAGGDFAEEGLYNSNQATDTNAVTRQSKNSDNVITDMANKNLAGCKK